MTITATPAAPTNVIGDLEPTGTTGVTACIDAVHLESGDTMYAKGFRRGACRKVLECLVTGGVMYVRVREGWYRWTRVYVNVL